MESLLRDSFNPLWINTALKRKFVDFFRFISFNPLWINTALKLYSSRPNTLNSFNPLWINTALKRNDREDCGRDRFNPLWINTALKLEVVNELLSLVSIPYGLTLLSNALAFIKCYGWFQSPMD